MQESSTKSSTILVFRQEVERQLRVQIRQAVEVALDEELAAALGSGRHERTDARRGYRHGTVERRLTTGDGLRVITVPRGWSPPTARRRSFGARCCHGMRDAPARWMTRF